MATTSYHIEGNPPTEVLANIERDMAYGDKHYTLCEAASEGDYEAFMKMADKATKNDLEWAVESATDLGIIKYIIEVRGIKGFTAYAYKNAILNGIKNCDIL